MTLNVDLFYSMRSPYSYLLTPRLDKLIREYDVEIALRPVVAIAARDPEFFKHVNPLWMSYFMHDTKRVAERHGVDFRWPKPDPIVQNIETRAIADEQPYIFRLTRLCALAQERGRGFPFVREISAVIFSGHVDDWHLGDHLDAAMQRAGLDPAAMNAGIEGETERLDAVIAANHEAQTEAGHWGTPLMVFKGEPFYGQDRFDDLVWRLGQHGLEAR